MPTRSSLNFSVFFFFLSTTFLYLFSYFYTDFYPVSLEQGDELAYFISAGQMNENNLSFFEKCLISLGSSLSFLWPVILSYVPNLSLESNNIFLLARITLLLSACTFFFKTFKLNNFIIILLIPFILQASIYAGTLYRDDIIFSIFLFAISLLHRNVLSPLGLILVLVLISLRASLIGIIIPIGVSIIFIVFRKNNISKFIYVLCALIFLLIIYLGVSQGLFQYSINLIGGVSLDIGSIFRPFLSPINPFLVESNIRYDNPVIFILMNPIKILFLISLILLFFLNIQFKNYFEVFFILAAALPYIFFPENLGMRQSIAFQFCLYAFILNNVLKVIVNKDNLENGKI